MTGVMEALRAFAERKRAEQERERARLAEEPDGFHVVLAAGWDHLEDEALTPARCVASSVPLSEAILLAIRAEREERAEGGPLRTFITDAAGCLIDTDHN